MANRGRSNGRTTSNKDWLCKGCKVWGKPYVNHGWRTACNKCGVAKGQCFAKNIEPAEPSMRTSDNKKGVQDKGANQEMAKLRKEIEQLKAARDGASAKPEGKGAADEPMEEGGTAEARIAALRTRIKAIQAHEGCPVLGPALQELRVQLDAELRAKRAEQPCLVRVKHIEDIIKRTNAKAEKLRDQVLPQCHQAVAAAEKKLADAQESIAELERKTSELVAEKEDLLRAEAEASGPTPQRLDACDVAAEAGRLHTLLRGLPAAFANDAAEAAFTAILASSGSLQQFVAQASTAPRHGATPGAQSSGAGGLWADCEPDLAVGTEAQQRPIRDPGIDSENEFPEEWNSNPLEDEALLATLGTLDSAKKRAVVEHLERVCKART
jgi:hypothetical protein